MGLRQMSVYEFRAELKSLSLKLYTKVTMEGRQKNKQTNKNYALKSEHLSRFLKDLYLLR